MDDPGRLSVRVKRGGAFVARWSFDAVEAANVIGDDFGFSTGLPGGAKELSLSLPRDPTEGHSDLQRFDEIEVEGAGQERAWEGRAVEFPAVGGDIPQIGVEAVGHSAHLSDDPSYRKTFVDADFESWGEPPNERMLALQAADTPYDVDVHVSVKNGAIRFKGITDKSMPGQSRVELWNRSPAGVKIDRAQVRGTERNESVWDGFEFLATDDEDAASVDTYAEAMDGNIQTRNFTDARRYVFIRARKAGTHTQTNPFHRNIDGIRLFGEDVQTASVDGDFDGVAGHRALEAILSEAAPLCRFSVGGEDPSIESGSDFVIPHLAIREPTTAEEAIALVNTFYLRNWFLGDDKTFYWRSRDNPRRRWIANRSRGDAFTPLGPEGDDSVNGVIVSYTEPGGEPRTVGPPGSGADATDSELRDDSPTNVVNMAGIPRRWLGLSMPYVTTEPTAIRIGKRFLAELARVEVRGQGTLIGTVVDYHTRAEYPSWAVRAGDAIRWSDVSDDPWRLVIGTDYKHAGRVNSIDLDSPPATIEAYMERLGVSLIGKIAGQG